MKFSKNLLVQLLSLVFLALTFSGFNVVPDELASRIVEDLSNGQFIALLLYLTTNVANVAWHWYGQWKSDPKKILSFLGSINFWVATGNIILGIVLMITGVQIDPEIMTNFIELIFSGDYWGAAVVFIADALIPVIKSIVNKKMKEVVPV